MSRDGTIINADEPILKLRCYKCSRPINLYKPKEGHEDCVGQVSIYPENYKDIHGVTEGGLQGENQLPFVIDGWNVLEGE